MSKIILTGGGTAGHCIPNVAIIPQLKSHFKDIVYVGSKYGIEKNIIEKEDIPFYEITCAKLDRSNLLKNISTPIKVLQGINQAGKIIDKIMPDVIFSKGGYVSVPLVIAAAKRKIPIVLHESDYTVGLANKICLKFSNKILTSFPETAKGLKNSEYVGSPVRKSLFNFNREVSLKYFGFDGKKPIILVTGGSQGARAVNSVFRAALPNLLPRYDIIHICGKGNLEKENTPQGYYQVEYLEKMEHALNLASVCISRAGANTLFELMALKVPSILIPLPKTVSRGDQILNAEYFQKLGLTYVLNQNVLTKDSITYAINSVYSNRLNIIRNISKQNFLDSNEKIVKIICDSIK